MAARPDALIWDDLDEGYYEVDLAGRFLFVNHSFARLFGLAPGDLIGRIDREFLSDGSAREVYGQFNAVFRTGEPRRVGKTTLTLRDRTPFSVSYTVALRRGPDGAPAGFWGFLRDLSGRGANGTTADDILIRFRELTRAIPDVVYLKDGRRRNQAVNSAFEKMCGRTSAEVVGRTDEELFPPDLAAACRASDDRVLASGQTLRFEEPMTGPDGRTTHYETIKSPIRNAAGEVTGIIGISRDISDRMRTDAALRESEERFRTLYENATLGLYRTTPDGRILLANPTFLRMFGFDSFEEIAAEKKYLPEYSRAEFKDRLEKEGLIRGLEAVWRKKDGTKVYIRESARAIKDAEGRVLCYEGTVEDVTERKTAELELRESEAKFRQIFDRSLEGIYRTTVEGRMLSANPAMLRMFGYGSLEEFLAVDVRDHYTENETRPKLLEILKGGDEIRNSELRLRRKDGTVFHALENAAVVRDDEGRIDYIVGMLADITDLVQSKAALQSALRERETLLKEIHHRVKNNLQVVSSLLSLQARILSDPQAVSAFQDSQARVRSMALIHESLYRSDSLSRVDFDAYIRNLAQALIGSQASYPGRIELRLDLEPATFDIKTAIPLGLIINELVTNALKHAFPRDRKGTVAVGLRRLAGDEFLLTVKDDGVGLPEDMQVGRSKSMGLQLVEMLTSQLDGRVEIGPPPGADFRIRFHASVSNGVPVPAP